MADPSGTPYKSNGRDIILAKLVKIALTATYHSLNLSEEATQPISWLHALSLL